MDPPVGYRLVLVFVLAVIAPSAVLAFVSLAAIERQREETQTRVLARLGDEVRELALACDRRLHEPREEAERTLDLAARAARTLRDLEEPLAATIERRRLFRAGALVLPSGLPLEAPPPEAPPRATPLDEIFRAAEDLERRGGDPVGALQKLEEVERAHPDDEQVRAEALAHRARLSARIDAFPHNVYEALERLITRYPLVRDRDGSVLSLGARLEMAGIWRRLGDDAAAARTLEDLLRFLARREGEVRPAQVQLFRELALARLREISPEQAARAERASDEIRRDREAARSVQALARGAPGRVRAALEQAVLASREPGGAGSGTWLRIEAGRPPLLVRPLFAAGGGLLGGALLEPDLDLARARDLLPVVAGALSREEVTFRLAARDQKGEEDLARERLRPPLEEVDVVAARRPALEGKDDLLPLADRLRIYAFGLAGLGLLAGAVIMVGVVRKEIRQSALQSDFVTTVTHELKTPLTSIGMFAETLLMGRVESEDEERECLEIIVKETDRLTRLIDRVLTFSKIEAGRKRFDLRLTDLREHVEETIRLFETQMRGATPPVPPVEVVATHELKDVLVDRGSLQEVLLNLLSNAYKYGGEEKRIQVTLTKRRRWAIVEVRDWGMGIPRSEQGKIFRKFYRTDNRLTREVEGSGIGLTLAQSIARAHRGDITVRSKVGQGSTFIVWLPW